jgi:hypothetical protein
MDRVASKRRLEFRDRSVFPPCATIGVPTDRLKRRIDRYVAIATRGAGELMARDRLTRLLLAVLLTCIGDGSAEAQMDFGADLGVASQYMWRGTTIVNRPVLQPGLWVSHSFGDGSATLSLWGNVEIGKYDSRSALSEAGGAHAFDLTEIDPTLEVAWPLGNVELVVGASGYLYPNQSGYTLDDNAAEVYGRVALPGWWGITHTLSAYQDVTAIDGAYLEMGLSRAFPLRKGTDLEFTATAGWSIGQGVEYDGAGEVKEPGNFEGNGFTHAELSLAMPLDYGRFSIEPSAHLVFAHDDATRLNSGTSERDVKFWFGVVASFDSSGGN